MTTVIAAYSYITGRVQYSALEAMVQGGKEAANLLCEVQIL